MPKKKLLVVTPHLSTGGAPQVTLNKIELIHNECEIKCVEYSMIAWDYVVQRNKIINILGSNFHSLGEDKSEIIRIIADFKPDIISMEDIPEFFMDDNIASFIYRKDRTYKIFETTHDSSFPVEQKKWFPDKFTFVSAFNAFRYSMYDIPYDIIEYPVDIKQKRQEEMQRKLGFEPGWKHVINVGLFTPRKNQKYIFEIAERLKDYKIKFHFIGNQAPNFSFYWQPLMDTKPNNCKIWYEKSNVSEYLEASDVFLFTSRGDRNNKELNPIAIKEALEYQMPMLMFNLDVYCGKYNNFDNIKFLTGNIEEDSDMLMNVLGLTTIKKNFDLTYESDSNKITITTINAERKKYKVSIRDSVSTAPIYWFEMDNTNSSVWFAIPIPTHVFKFSEQEYFKGFLVEFYNENNVLEYSEELIITDNLPDIPKLNFTPFDCNFINYTQFFSRDIYRNFNLDNLDTVIDVGANVGLFSKYILNKKAKKVIAIEANPFLSVSLSKILYDDINKVRVYMNPLLSEKKTVNFKYSPSNSTIGAVESYSNNNNNPELTSSFEIESITMNEIINDNDITKISLFKCDVEGGEYDIMESLTEDQMKMIDQFLIEYHINTNNKLDIITNKLRKFGFEYDLFSESLSGGLKKINSPGTEGVLVTRSKLSTVKQQKHKIRLVHLQTTVNDPREVLSRKSLRPLNNLGIEYVLYKNAPYVDLPPKDTCLRPQSVSPKLFNEEETKKFGSALTPAHYGCFKSFKDAILDEFTDDVDFLILCEGDCLLEVSPERFVDVAQHVCDVVNEYGIDYFSFGDSHLLDNGEFISGIISEIPNQDLLYITNKIIGLQCIMFPKSIKNFLINQLNNHKWDAADLYFNIIFNDFNKKMGILKHRITTQADGVSFLDKTEKTFKKKNSQ